MTISAFGCANIVSHGLCASVYNSLVESLVIHVFKQIDRAAKAITYQDKRLAHIDVNWPVDIHMLRRLPVRTEYPVSAGRIHLCPIAAQNAGCLLPNLSR